MAKAWKSTKDIKIPKNLVDQVIGQEDAVRIIKKAAGQRRHVLLIGEPGTGKSLLGLALAKLLPKETLVDVLAFANPNDEHQPQIRTVPAGKGRKLVTKTKMQSLQTLGGPNIIFMLLPIISMMGLFYAYRNKIFPFEEPIVFAAGLIALIIAILGATFIFSVGRRMMPQAKGKSPKTVVDNFGKETAPFWDATGAHAGALLGDVLHDPLQSGGMGTPAHERVVAGMIHKANMGVLFIDEIATLKPSTQQELLTALQEGKYSITGQSERSSGAMVRTEAVPCNFILVAAGNLETIKNMHPALRSRIRGYGYEVFMQETFHDTPANRALVARFVAQEVKKDKKIPHFARSAVNEIIDHARRMANRKNRLTLRFRELGGLIRAAGDVAAEEKTKLVEKKHVTKAKTIARTLEKQIADRIISRKKEYEVIMTAGKMIGRVNGLAVIGGGGSYSGLIMPIECEVTKGNKEKTIVATGKLGDIAKEAIKNVTAIIKKNFGDDIKDYDVYVQFLQTYEGVEGDSASIAVALSIISSLKKVPVRQDVAMTGSLSVRGKVLPVGGVSAKVEAAIHAGMKKVLIPHSNMQDIVIPAELLKKVKLIPVTTLQQVLVEAMDWTGKKNILKKIKGL
jgi:ATP-dependent Lon protease